MQCKIARCKTVILHVTDYRKILFSTLLLLKTLIKKKYLVSYSVVTLDWNVMLPFKEGCHRYYRKRNFLTNVPPDLSEFIMMVVLIFSYHNCGFLPLSFLYTIQWSLSPWHGLTCFMTTLWLQVKVIRWRKGTAHMP